MHISRLVLFFIAGFFLMPGCANNSDKKVGTVNNDSLKNGRESEDSGSLTYESCYENFFKGLPRFSDSSSAYLLLQDGKRKSLTQFFKDEFMSPISEYGLNDLDADGVMELIIFNYTGGPHCCDEYFIFRQKNERAFEYKAHLMGGQACIDAVTHTISYSFSETLGYFFSCYACEFSDSSGTFKNIREIQLKYSGSKLKVISYDTASERQNLANLAILQKHEYEKVEGMMDNGWRKEFAINFAIWHYNHGKNWKKTKKLFDKYYDFQDEARVWKEFHRTLIESEKENSF
ncbi:MAG: hypothetical protein ABIN89_01320 [Chitinophagaceae bacterium]